jgi:hypothetical protein
VGDQSAFNAAPGSERASNGLRQKQAIGVSGQKVKILFPLPSRQSRIRDTPATPMALSA